MAKRSKISTSRSRVRPVESSLTQPQKLLNELRRFIEESRERVAAAVNAALVMLYWEVGRSIRTEILKSSRAAYGEEIVPTLSAQLVVDSATGSRNEISDQTHH